MLLNSHQLWNEAHEHSHADAEKRFYQPVQSVRPGLGAVSEHDDATDISGQLCRGLQVSNGTEQHGSENAQPDCQRTRWQHVGECGANRRPDHGTSQALQR